MKLPPQPLKIDAPKRGSNAAESGEIVAPIEWPCSAGCRASSRAGPEQPATGRGPTALGPEHEPLALAPLVAYLPDERVLVQEEAPGVSLHEVLSKSDVAEAVELGAVPRGPSRPCTAST